MTVPAPVTVLTDDDIRARLTPPRAVAAMRAALLAAHTGALTAPPRAHAALDGGRLVFTAGALRGRWFGYRSYDSFGADPGEQVVVLHEAAHGRVRAIATGNALGPRRVGAIGAVAVDALAVPGPATLGLLGTGTQAWAQLWAIAAVRELTAVRVYSRDPARRAAFAADAAATLGLPVTAVDAPRAAVHGAGIVVLATSSAVPVLDPGWLAPGCFVTTLGPKQRGRAEFGPELVTAADVVVTDSLAQIGAYDPPNVVADAGLAHRLTGLGAVLAGDAPGRTDPAQRVLFCSVGLAGTEVYLLASLVDEPPGG